MTFLDSHQPFTDAQRHRIIADIMRWKVELEIDNEFPPKEFQAYADDLRTENDQNLQKIWEETVGEWLASRGDLDLVVEIDSPTIVGWHKSLAAPKPDTPPKKQVEFNEWLNTQFENLIAGKDTSYGFIVEVNISPNATKEATA